MIVRDAQGITGKKVEIYSLPYSAINMWSSENAGKFDLDAELELWTRAGHIKIKVGKKADIRRLDMFIAPTPFWERSTDSARRYEEPDAVLSSSPKSTR